MTDRDWLKEIVGIPLASILYESHPSDDILRTYLLGRLAAESGSFKLEELRAGTPRSWQRPEVTAHILTCSRCAQVITHLRTESTVSSRSWRKALAGKFSGRRLQPVPALARAVMAAQFVIILALAGVIYWKPAQLFPPPAAVLLDTSKGQPPPATPQVQTAVPSAHSDISQLIQVLHSAPDPQERLRAAELLGQYENSSAVEALAGVLDVTDPHLRETASRALEQIWRRTETQYLQIRQAFGNLRSRYAERQSDTSLKLFLENFVQVFQSFESEAAYPYTLRVTFKNDARAGEIEGLIKNLNGVLVYGMAGQHEFVVKLPGAAGPRLNEIVQQLQENPQIVEVRKD